MDINLNRMSMVKSMNMANQTIKDLNSVFNAKSVAVVGASDDLSKFGGTTLQAIIHGEFQGRIYPVNPKADYIQGLKAYHSINEISEKLDAAVIVIPAKFVPDVVQQAATKGVRVATVLSAGFREAGNQALEDELIKTAHDNGIRIMGPNIQGFHYVPNQLCAMLLPLEDLPGPLAVVSRVAASPQCSVNGRWMKDLGFQQQ